MRKRKEVWVFIPGWNAEAIADAAQSAEVSADGQSTRCRNFMLSFQYWLGGSQKTWKTSC